MLDVFTEIILAISVLLADDSEPIRRAICHLLEGHPEITVVAQASDFSEAVRFAEQLRPDVVLLDLRMRDRHGPDALAASLKLLSAGSTILAISFVADADAEALASQIGAVKLIDKMSLYKKLIPAILEVTK